ncbi:ferrous iron transport protein B [Candidatus Aminicenantes bacterium AH-873-B07]|jgi:ferrous iron transport protein B|nr:ferrous iron transport protein B [Candidatus Aminicenantes bacterium AH-873-B07]
MSKEKLPTIIFIGQPNSGKSTLFNSIAGLKGEVSNFPGTTVKHAHSKVNIKGKVFQVIDLPGTYSLNPSDEAEKEVLNHLFLEKVDLIINVIDASLLNRSLELTLELMETGYPIVLALNMMDITKKKGIKIDIKKLEKILGIPVVPVIATRGKGVKELLDIAEKEIREPSKYEHPEWSKPVEEKIKEVAGKLTDNFAVPFNKRFLAIKLIEGERYFLSKIKINRQIKDIIKDTSRDLETWHKLPPSEVISANRHHLSMKIAEEVSQIEHARKIGWEERIDEILMHPFLGYLIMFVVFFIFFFFIFKIGNPLEELLYGPLYNFREFISIKFGSGLIYYLMDGLVQGIGGGLAIVLPYFIPLIFGMALLEDFGYLARVGFLMDTFVHRIGLHGKSIAPFVLGFGCNVPAIMATRLLESKRDRIITSLLIPFIPCTARTTVILALIAFYLGPLWAFAFYIFNLFLIALIGRIITIFFPSPSPGLILEIPSYKIPSFKSIGQKTYFKLKSFINFAWPILIIGSVFLSFIQYLGLDKFINSIFSPLVFNILGLPKELGITLIFGILRKELSLIMMLQALGVDTENVLSVISPQQIVVFTVFLSLFIPCVSTISILWREIGKRIALISAILNSIVALTISFLIKIIFQIIQ